MNEVQRRLVARRARGRRRVKVAGRVVGGGATLLAAAFGVAFAGHATEQPAAVPHQPPRASSVPPPPPAPSALPAPSSESPSVAPSPTQSLQPPRQLPQQAPQSGYGRGAVSSGGS